MDQFGDESPDAARALLLIGLELGLSDGSLIVESASMEF